MSRRPPALLAGLLLGLAACSPSEPPLPASSIPLSALASSARVLVETDALNIGDPADRQALWSGWGPDEKNQLDTFAWGLGEASHVRLEVVQPRRRVLRLRGWSYPFGDDPPLEISFRVNGELVGQRVVDSRPGMLQLAIERDAWRLGENDLELSYSRHVAKPGELPLAAGWAGLRFDDSTSDPARRPRFDAGDVVVLPARTALEWTLELPPGSFLAWDGSESVSQGRLVVRAHDEERELPIGRALAAHRLRLTDDGGAYRLVSFSLGSEGEDGSVRVFRPRVYLPKQSGASPVAEAGAAAPPVAAAGRRSPNLMIYLIDTLRADHLGCYGYRRPTSPEIDRFARNAVLWREGRAQSSWTRPAVATVLTGLQPITHRTQQSYDRLPEDVVTLSERLQAAGWQTAMITANGNVSERFGFNQGWDHFTYLPESLERRAHHVQSPAVNREVFKWLARRDRQRPFLLFVHTTDPHDPYTPNEKFRRRLAPQVDPSIGTRDSIARLARVSDDEALAVRSQLEELYDAEIAANDESFGHLMRRLRNLGLADDTAVLLLSDHGEEFFEHHGFTHGRTLYEEQLRIPFLLRLPGGRRGGTVLPGPAEQIDVVPTLLALAGLAPDPALPGRDLLADLEAAVPRDPEAQSLAWLARNDLTISSIVRSQWKLIRNDRTGGDWDKLPFELFGLGSDPDELHDLAPSLPLRRAWLEGLLLSGWRRFESGKPGETTEIDSELAANLRALGYL